jgi:Zn-finger nucleic acid-binding protein
MTCRLCEKPSQVRCSRCGGGLCGFHAGLHVETCPRCGQPWFGTGTLDQAIAGFATVDPTIERLQVLARVEHMAEAPGPYAHRQASAGLSAWIQVAKRIGIPREQWLLAARRGAARRARAQRQGIVERLAG